MPASPALAHNLALAAELERHAAAARDAGVAVIVLKGVPLARRAYGRLDARAMVDNDLLVHRGDAPAAYELLRGLGYQDRPHRSFAADLAHLHEYSMHRTLPHGSTLMVDLHWAPWSPLKWPADEQLIWSHAAQADEAAGMLVFDPAMTIVHLASHYATDRFARRQVLADIAAAWNRWHADIDRDGLLDLARRTRLDHALAYGLRAADAAGLLRASPPAIPSRRASVLARLAPTGRSERPDDRYDRIGTALSLTVSTPWRAVREVAHMAFPPISELAHTYRRPPSPALYLRYLVRPLRPIARALKLPPP